MGWLQTVKLSSDVGPIRMAVFLSLLAVLSELCPRQHLHGQTNQKVQQWILFKVSAPINYRVCKYSHTHSGKVERPQKTHMHTHTHSLTTIWSNLNLHPVRSLPYWRYQPEATSCTSFLLSLRPPPPTPHTPDNQPPTPCTIHSPIGWLQPLVTQVRAVLVWGFGQVRPQVRTLALGAVTVLGFGVHLVFSLFDRCSSSAGRTEHKVSTCIRTQIYSISIRRWMGLSLIVKIWSMVFICTSKRRADISRIPILANTVLMLLM